MLRQSWLGILCGCLLLVTPLLAQADAVGNGGGNSRWDKPPEKSASPAKVQLSKARTFDALQLLSCSTVRHAIGVHMQ